MKRIFGLEYYPETRMGPVSQVAYVPQCGHHVEKRASKILLRQQWEMVKSTPECPSMWTFLGSPDSEIRKVAGQVYRGEHRVAPSILSHRQQDECMRELCQDLSRHMTRAGL